jgi:quercetin dioxygenase-like cupin family protein
VTGHNKDNKTTLTDKEESPVFRCVRIWTGDDENSQFEEGITTTSFRETKPGGTLTWHTAPVRQLVITLSGTLEFETREGQRFQLATGDILLAEDTVGGGHSWRIIDDQPWRRVYIVLAPDAHVPFKPLK